MNANTIARPDHWLVCSSEVLRAMAPWIDEAGEQSLSSFRLRSGQIESISMLRAAERCKMLLKGDIECVHIIVDFFDAATRNLARTLRGENGRILFYEWSAGHLDVIASVSSPEPAISEAWLANHELPGDWCRTRPDLREQYRTAIIRWERQHEAMLHGVNLDDLDDEGELDVDEEEDRRDPSARSGLGVVFPLVNLRRIQLHCVNDQSYSVTVGHRGASSSAEAGPEKKPFWEIPLELKEFGHGIESVDASLYVRRPTDVANEYEHGSFSCLLRRVTPESVDFEKSGWGLEVVMTVDGLLTRATAPALRLRDGSGWQATGKLLNTEAIFHRAMLSEEAPKFECILVALADR